MKVVNLEMERPTACPNLASHQGQPCNVIKRGTSCRTCYDLEFPFCLQYPNYSCNGIEFTALNERIIDAIPPDMQTSVALAVMGRIIMVTSYMIDLKFNSDSDFCTTYNINVSAAHELHKGSLGSFQCMDN